MIATGGALVSLFTRSGPKVVKAIWEGFRNGRRAAWLPGEDYDRLLAQPFAEARARLNITMPAAYHTIAGGSGG
jgi:ubiquinone biosynthesis protein COQ4